ncbi:hypothetical protein DINM_022810 [Dirofilaria immitis]|nr:hypothetical protein [Dirofilaria immitis]
MSSSWKEMEYTVTQSDSIERIAAVHDCTVGELMKMNRLATRMVFPGQKLLVPHLIKENDATSTLSGNHRSVSQTTIVPECNAYSNGYCLLAHGRKAIGNLGITIEEGDRIQRGPGMAVKIGGRVTTKSDPSRTVKQMTEMNGTVTGTLLVTPNALMFDPDVVHPLVLQNGQDVYIMMAQIEEVVSVTMFKSTTLTDAKGDGKVHDLVREDSSIPECSTVPVIVSYFVISSQLHIGYVGSNFQSSPIVKKGNKLDDAVANVSRTVRRTYSDLSNGQKSDEMSTTLISRSENKQPYSSHPSSSVDNARTGLICNPLSKLGRTLTTHANTIRGSVTSGAERMTQSAMSGTKSVAQGVVSQSKAVAGTLQTGIQTSVKMAASHAKTAVGAVAAVPQGIAIMGSGLFSSQYPTIPFFEDKAISKTRKEQNLATLLSLKEKAHRFREETMRNKHSLCATSMDEMLDLFKPIDELLSLAQTFPAAEKSAVADSSYYMHVHLSKNKKFDKGQFAALDAMHSSPASTEDIISNCARQEFWFAIPKHKVDAIYHFLLQWNSEKFGSNTQEMHPVELTDRKKHMSMSWLMTVDF